MKQGHKVALPLRLVARMLHGNGAGHRPAEP